MLAYQSNVLSGAVAMLLLVAQTEALDSVSKNPLRAAKCLIPNGIEHAARAAFLQQCISKNYGQGNETRCYGELGCFPMDQPWTSLLRPLPSPIPPQEIQVALQCFTREDPKQMHAITLWDDISMNSCPFDSNRMTVFLTHGFASHGNFSWLHEFKDRYLAQVDANFFIVDWGLGAQLLNYLQVASNTRIVAAEVTRFVHYLQQHMSMKADNMHLIGHSLGAQISSYVAKKTPGVGRLTGLDPAQPGFEGTDLSVRMNKNDAAYVEAVHTNAAPFIPAIGFGMIQPVGHVDFYINGGVHQPGCMKLATQPEVKSILDLGKYTVETIGQWVCCSHCRAYEMYMRVMEPDCVIWGRLASFTSSLLNAGTVGISEKLVLSKLNKCTAQTCLPLRLDTPTFPARGVFAATTTIKEPFCEKNPEVNNKKLKEIAENEKDPDIKIPGLPIDVPVGLLKPPLGLPKPPTGLPKPPTGLPKPPTGLPKLPGLGK